MAVKNLLLGLGLLCIVLLVAACENSKTEETPVNQAVENSVGQQAEAEEASDSNNDQQVADTTDETRMIDHLSGQTQITGTPERVVVMEYGLLGSLLSFGVAPIGYTDDERLETLEELGYLEQMGDYTPIGSRQQPNLEVIRTLKPDLIIGDYARHGEVYEQLRDIAPTLMLPDSKATYEEAIENHLKIGAALNQATAAESAVADHKQLLGEIVAQLPSDRNYLLVALGDNVFNVRTNQFFQPSMLVEAGVQYAYHSEVANETAIKASIEQMLDIDPDVMFVSNPDYLEQWKDDPLFAQLKAVKNDQVYPVLHSRWSFNRSIPASNVLLEELGAFIPSIN